MVTYNNKGSSTLSYLLPIAERLKDEIAPAADLNINPSQVYNAGDARARAILSDEVIKYLLRPGSGIRGLEYMEELYRRSQRGESCIVMMEHYGNFDLPGLYHLLSLQGEDGLKMADSLLAIQAIKLTSTGGNPLTAVFASCYSTITIYPSRHLDQIEEQERQNVRRISVPLNHAAMRELTCRKYQGRILLIFPAGTRYRPWVADSKAGVREIRSYLKVFQNVVFVGINGNLLLPSPDENMANDTLKKDVLIYTFSPIINGREFLKEKSAKNWQGIETKRFIATEVMKKLEELHQDGKQVYQKLVQQLDSLAVDELPNLSFKQGESDRAES